MNWLIQRRLSLIMKTEKEAATSWRNVSSLRLRESPERLEAVERTVDER